MSPDQILKWMLAGLLFVFVAIGFAKVAKAEESKVCGINEGYTIKEDIYSLLSGKDRRFIEKALFFVVQKSDDREEINALTILLRGEHPRQIVREIMQSTPDVTILATDNSGFVYVWPYWNDCSFGVQSHYQMPMALKFVQIVGTEGWIDFEAFKDSVGYVEGQSL